MSKDNPVVLYVGIDNKLYQTHPKNGALIWNLREDELVKLLEYYDKELRYGKLVRINSNPFKVVVKLLHGQTNDFVFNFEHLQKIAYAEDWSYKLVGFILGV